MSNPRYANGALRRANRARLRAMGGECGICHDFVDIVFGENGLVEGERFLSSRVPVERRLGPCKEFANQGCEPHPPDLETAPVFVNDLEFLSLRLIRTHSGAGESGVDIDGTVLPVLFVPRLESEHFLAVSGIHGERETGIHGQDPMYSRASEVQDARGFGGDEIPEEGQKMGL